mmetsp:Transcript_1461/g.5181  ORF Transcript_1461/g.5181 Transcript_1461/m.5181 type:complete len:1023 (+) Transcript_1461:59-3127(+)
MASLHEALRLQVQDFDVKEWLKTHGVDEVDDQAQTALHIACTEGNFTVAKALVRKKANVNVEDGKKWTPLHCAASGSHYEICELLIQNRANVNALTADDSCAMGYIAKGHRGDSAVQTKLMDLMLSKGADVDVRNKHDETPLLRSALVGSEQAVGWLLANGADSMATNKYGETLLHAAVRSGRPSIVKLALTYGVDIFAKSDQSKTAFDEAKEMGHDEVIAVLDNFLDGPNEAVKRFREELAPLLALESSKKRRSQVRAARGSIYLSTGGNDGVTKEVTQSVRTLLALLQTEASAIAALPSGRAIVEQCKRLDELLPGSTEETASPAAEMAKEEPPPAAEAPVHDTEQAGSPAPQVPPKRVASSAAEPTAPRPPPKRIPSEPAAPPRVPQRRNATDSKAVEEAVRQESAPLSGSLDTLKRRSATMGGGRGRGRGGAQRGRGAARGGGRGSGRALPTPPGPSLSASMGSNAPSPSAPTAALRASTGDEAPERKPPRLTRSVSPPPNIGNGPTPAASVSPPAPVGTVKRPTPPAASLAPRRRERAASDCGNGSQLVPRQNNEVQKRIVAAEKMDIVAKLQAMANQQGQAGEKGDKAKDLTASGGKKAKKEKGSGSLLKKKGAISAGFATLKRSSVMKDSRDEDAESPAKERKSKPKPEPEPEPEPEVPKTDPMVYWNELSPPEPKLLQQPQKLGDDATAEDKQMQTRNTALEEIICTETQYVRSLAVVIAFYLKPLRNDHGDLVSAGELQKIFSNVEALHKVSSRLLAMLNEQVQKPPAEQRIGDIFLGELKELAIYNTYCTNQVDSMTTLQELRDTKPAFVDFLEETKQHELTTAEPVDGLLIKPFQRICRYVLLLRELHKRTPKQWEDKAQIKAAMDGVDSIVREANETKRVMDNLMKTQEIQEKLDCDLDIKRAVKFVLEGDFKELDAKGHPEKRHFFLFNSLLIVAKPKKGGKYTMRDQIPIENCIIWDVADSGKVKHAFQIVRTDATTKLVMICSSNAQKDNWMNAINENISSSGAFVW